MDVINIEMTAHNKNSGGSEKSYEEYLANKKKFIDEMTAGGFTDEDSEAVSEELAWSIYSGEKSASNNT